MESTGGWGGIPPEWSEGTKPVLGRGNIRERGLQAAPGEHVEGGCDWSTVSWCGEVGPELGTCIWTRIPGVLGVSMGPGFAFRHSGKPLEPGKRSGGSSCMLWVEAEGPLGGCCGLGRRWYVAWTLVVRKGHQWIHNCSLSSEMMLPSGSAILFV